MIEPSRAQFKSVLHDMIKSAIYNCPEQTFDICKKIPEIKTSRIIKGEYWKFEGTRQEVENVKHRKADVVYFYSGKKGDVAYHVHEVKTGSFNPEEIFEKYHTGMTVYILVWGFKKYIIHPYNSHNGTLKIIPIDYLEPFLLQVFYTCIDILKESCHQ